ncbi:MAG: helix-turn-helix transcriptional regulator [Archaeoglobus sp.]|uniref:winged helix-turn-helix transcriptional regulator n=1 Tax=Archaeoglobus sp. TaxID=1872626 RepID=UPI001E0DA9EE|nr:helix-turn-helix domain-containing protein [Archaeoglobus sp.]MBO8179819.1 helix-turn-helix transcriptional regulator [Archaeoglobus sp.]
MEENDTDLKKVEEALKVISRSGVNFVILSLEDGPKKFSQIMAETNLNPGIVDRSLKALMELGLVSKKAGKYELTDKGEKMLGVIKSIFDVVKENS